MQFILLIFITFSFNLQFLAGTVAHRYQMSHHQEYQTDASSASGQQQHSILGGHMDPGMSAEDEQQQTLQLEKYFKYSHPTSMAHSSLSSQSMLDSNHNYASDLRYYGAPPQSQLDIPNSQCIVDDQQGNKDARCAIGHTMEQYHPGLEVSKYTDHSVTQQHQQPQLQQQQQQQQQSMEHVPKADDDFSVILADVRKTCYSS